MSGPRPGDNPDYDRNEREAEPELEEMEKGDWLEKWELERGLTPNLPSRDRQFAVTVAMDAFRLCIGLPPRNHQQREVVRWMEAMRGGQTAG